MPNRETVRALVSAFNVHNYARNTVKTNFTLQSEGKKDYIVVSFDKGTKGYQCSEYLYNIKRKIVGEFYGIEEGDTDEVVLNTANLIFNIESFPFDTSRGKWSQDEQGRIEFLAPIDKGVIFNLKSHLASSLKTDILEDMSACRIVTKASNKKDYLWHGEFDNKGLRQQFEGMFLSRMENRYGYRSVFKKPLEVEGNSVYIKDVFDDARFIDSVTRYITWLKGMGLQADSKVRNDVKAFKDLIIEFIDQSTGLTVAGFLRNFPLNEKTAKILIPAVLDNGEPRVLASEEALKLNYAFNYAVFNNLYSKVQAELPINGDSGIYGIDFSNKEISHCVITKIIESSVINKDHELSIDPELRLQALSPMPNGFLSEAQLEFPTGSQSKELEGPPRRGFIGAHSGLVSVDQVDVPGMSREFPPSPQLSSIAVSCVVQGPSSSSQSVGAAQNVRAGTSAWNPHPLPPLPPLISSSGGIVPRFQPLTQVSSSGPSSWKSAAKNVQASTSARAQQTNSRLSQGTSGNKWQLLQFTEPGFSGLSWTQSSSELSSWKSANKSGSAGTSTRGSYSSPPPLISSSGGIVPRFQPPVVKSPLLLTPSLPGTSGNERSASVHSTDSGHPESPWPLTNERSASVRSTDSGHPESPWPLQFTSEGNIQPMDCLPSQGTLGEEELTINKGMQRKGAKVGANNRRTEPTHETLSKEKEELIKALLYVFNFCNYTSDVNHTNFTLENGKIVSKLNEIDKQKYLKKVRDYTINDCVTEEVAKRVYDVNQFPFVFSPDFQRDEEEKIIVAHNIDDAIPNLKIHLIQKFRIQVEEEAAKKLEKMGVTEACERIKESVYLAAKSRDSGVWYIFFDQKRFQRPDFEKFKSIYVEAFKSRWKKCGLDDSLVDYKNDALYIKDAIDINFVKKIEEYEKKEYEKLQASLCYSLEETSHICFPPEGIEGESPIALDGEGRYFLDHDFGSDCESMDCENTERDPLNRKPPLSSESNNSSSEGAGNPPSNLSESELCMGLHGANLGRK